MMELSANWKKLKPTLQTVEATQPPSHSLKEKKKVWKRKRPGTAPGPVSPPGEKPEMDTIRPESKVAAERINEGLAHSVSIGKYVAIDCEMVGVGPEPDWESALARVSFVNFNGEQIYDSYVKPKEAVTDWRTAISGISRDKMREARSLEQVQLDASKILEGRILVGHAVRNDLEALLLSHPRSDIRDTARHPPFRRLAGGSSPQLKILASEILGIEIQNGAHSSVEDARVTMLLFQREKEAFEREIARKIPSRKIRTKARPIKKRKKRNKKR